MEHIDTDKTKSCPTCSTANSVTAVFCSNCGLPIGNQVELNADSQLSAMGHHRIQESNERRSLITLIGLWIILGILSAGMVIILYYSYQDLNFILKVLLIAGLTLIVINLYKATNNYINTKNYKLSNKERGADGV